MGNFHLRRRGERGNGETAIFEVITATHLLKKDGRYHTADSRMGAPPNTHAMKTPLKHSGSAENNAKEKSPGKAET